MPSFRNKDNASPHPPIGREPRDIVIVMYDRALSREENSHDRFQRRGFSCPVCAHERDDLSPLDSEAQLPHRWYDTVIDIYAFNSQQLVFPFRCIARTLHCSGGSYLSSYVITMTAHHLHGLDGLLTLSQVGLYDFRIFSYLFGDPCCNRYSMIEHLDMLSKPQNEGHTVLNDDYGE